MVLRFSFTGFYVILGVGGILLILYFCRLALNDNSITQGDAILLWYVAGFNIVQHAILLPAFHLNEMKIVQENEELVDELVPVNS